MPCECWLKPTFDNVLILQQAFAAFEIRPESTLKVFPISQLCGGRGAFGEALDKLDSEMGKARELQYLVVVGATPASNDEVQSMIRGVAGKHDTEVCFAQSEESRRGANGDDRAHTGSLQTDSSINACKGAVIPWPKWTATGELQAACFGLAVQDSRKRNSAENGNKTGTDGHIEDIILPSKLWVGSLPSTSHKYVLNLTPTGRDVRAIRKQVRGDPNSPGSSISHSFPSVPKSERRICSAPQAIERHR